MYLFFYLFCVVELIGDVKWKRKDKYVMGFSDCIVFLVYLMGTTNKFHF